MKPALLEFLRAQAGEWCRPQRLADRLFIDLSDLDPEVAKLRAQGYRVELRPRLGYRLEGIEDRLVAYEITRGLGTSVIGAQVECHETVASTNDVARTRASEGAPEGTTILAEHQTAGRGRLGRAWESTPRSGVLMSVLLRPQLEATDVALLTVTAAVACAQTIQEHLRLPALIRWPNDVTIKGRKVAGVLVESGPRAGGEPTFVMGMGLNANLAGERMSPEVRETATSLAEHARKPIDRIALVRALLRSVDRWYADLCRGERARISSHWRQYSSTLGQHVTITQDGTSYRGRVLDISLEHGLIVRLDRGGVMRMFRPSEVTLCRRD